MTVTTIVSNSTAVLVPHPVILEALHFQMVSLDTATMMTLESLDTAAATFMLVVFTWRFIIIIQIVVGTTAATQIHISLLSPLRLVFIHAIFPIGVGICKK